MASLGGSPGYTQESRMIKKCPACNKKRDMRSNQKYCNAKCKKAFENSQRSAPEKTVSGNKTSTLKIPSSVKIIRPGHLNEIAAAYWDKIAPTVEARGHLNILSEDAFAELCDLHSRLRDINTMINLGTDQKCSSCGETVNIPGNRSLLQIDDKWSAKDSIETQTFKESALSDLKRKYSKLFLDYQNRFYLIPLANRGNFGLDNKDDVDPHDEFLNMGSK
jgi:hypothetical protein